MRSKHLLRVVALGLLLSVANTEDSTSSSISWFVQISDLHISKYNKSPIEHDLQLLADQVLARIKPSKVVLTGDLVDAKTKHGGSAQWESEWKAYREAWQGLARSSGLEAADILDVRGNHDVFNTIRTAARDRFMVHSARAAVSRESAAARVHVDLLQPQVQLGAAAPGGAHACPAGVLLGVDTTPVVGLKGPTNFLGVLRPEDMEEVERQLVLVMGTLHSRGCSPPIVAYGHHPLGTIYYPSKPVGAMSSTLGARLAAFDAAAYLCGHLHDVFGARLHRLHFKPSGALMAELEAADWKRSRRFRVMALDSGSLSFADLHFIVPPGAPRGVVVPVEPTRQISQHLVLISHPPPTLYSPLTSLQQQRLYRTVRCLVLPMAGQGLPGGLAHMAHGPPRGGAHAGGAAGAKVASVMLSWECGEERGAVQMVPKGKKGPVYQAGDLELMLQCRGPVELQVIVTDVHGGKSTSEVREVLMAPQLQPQGSASSPDPDSEDDPNLSFSWMERFMLHRFWSEFSGSVFLCLWSAHFWGMLLIPRFLGPYILAHLTPSRTQTLTPPGGWPMGALLGLLHWGWAWALWPLQVLVKLAAMRTAWAGMVLFSLNLYMGPWFLGSFFDGAPAGIFTAYGLYHPLPDPHAPPSTPSPHTLDRNPDVRIATVLHHVTCVLPLTLWIAAVVHRWAEHPDISGTPPPGPLGLSWRQVGALLPLVWLYWKMLGRLWSAYGMIAILASPAYGWLTVLVPLLLWHVRCRMAAARVLMPCRSLPKAID